MQYLLGILFSWVGKFFGDKLLQFVAWKVLIYSLLTITFPIVIKNLVKWGFDLVSGLIESNIDVGELGAAKIHLSGLAGYLANCLALEDCIAILLSAVAIRFTLNFIPFVG